MNAVPHILLTILLASSVFCANTPGNSPSVQYQPQPAINESQLFTLTNSPADDMLLLSNQLQSLELLHFSNPNGAGNLTNITLKHFNRSAPGKVSTYRLTILGNWTYAQSSYNSHSCNGLYETTNKLLGPLHFDKQKGQFSLLAQIPVQLLTGDPNTSLDQIRARANLGNNCKLLSYSFNNTFRVLTPNAILTNVIDVTLASNSMPKAISHDLTLAIWDNHLYGYDISTQSYAPLFTLAVADRYVIKNHGPRAVVASIVSHQVSVGVLSSNYTFSVFDLSRKGSQSLIGNFSIYGAVELANGTGLEYFISPKVTKVGVGFQQQASFIVMAKHIDYYQNKLVNLTFNNLTDTIQTAIGIDYQREFSLSDEFVVIKNVSKYANGASHPYPAAEETHQVVGKRIMLLRRRTISSSQELTKFLRAFIDFTVTEKCYVVQVYNGSSAGTYQVVEFQYGNLRSNYQQVRTFAPYYIDFKEPSTVNTYRSGHHLEWVYQIHQSGSHNFTAIWLSNATANHTQSASLLLGSTWTIHHQNFRCLLVEISGGGTVLLYRLNKATHQYDLVDTLSNLVAGVNLTIATLGSSHDCSRIRINNNIYIKSSNGGAFSQINVGFNWTVIDNDLRVVMASNGSLYKLDIASATFNPYTTVSLTTNPASSQIQVVNNNVAVIGSSSTTVEVFVYANDANGAVKEVFKFAYVGYSGVPNVAFSPNLTKIVIVGIVNSSPKIFKIDSFNIDFKSLTFNTVGFPLEPMAGASAVSIALGESFIYARQQSMKNTSDICQEFAYFLAGNIYPRLVYRNNISTQTGVSWSKTVIIETRRDYALLMTENINTTTTPVSVQVIRTELWGQQGNYDHGIEHYVVEISNGSAQVCSTGCMSCDCDTCFSGYYRDPSTSSCRPCSQSCATCDSIDTKICKSCFAGAYLDLTTSQCLPCAQGCITCSDNTTCTKCPPGQFISSGACQNCSSDCFNCTDLGTCLTCRQGYTLVTNSNGSVTCGTCSLYCSQCNSSNITQCTACGKGTFMNNGICNPCGNNCLACTSATICDVCIPGYTTNAQGACIMKCELPCLGCQEGHPTLCTSCQKGSVLNQTTKRCEIDLSCNNHSNCSSCGQGLNHILVEFATGATCDQCPNITNCIQCDYVNTYSCAICTKGFFSNSSGQCQKCMPNCIQCRTNTICSECQLGYTLMAGFTEGTCIKCQRPCATCLGAADNCLSCVSGSSKKGWACRNDTKFIFSFTINDNIANVIAKIHLIKKGCLTHLNSNNQDDIVFDSITTGSTIISGSGQVSGGSQNINQAAHSFSQGIASGIPGTSYTASNVNVQVQEANDTHAQQESSKRKIAIIAGVVIAVVVTILIIIVICCVIRSRRRDNTEEFEEQGGAMNTKQTPSESSEKEKKKQRIEKLSGSDTANNLGGSMSSVRYPNLDKDLQ